MQVRRFVTLASFTVLAAASSSSMIAQAPKAPASEPQLALVSFARVQPGKVREYIDLQIKEVIPAQKKGGSPGRQAYSSAMGGPPGEFVYVTPITSLARFDEPSPMIKALGEEGAAAVQAKIAALAEPAGSSIIRVRTDLSVMGDPKAAPAPLAIITVVGVVPGKRAEFEAFIKKDVIPAMQQAKVKSYHVMEILYGENTGGFVTAIGYDSYAAIGKGHPFAIALGEEGAKKLESRAAGIVSNVYRFVSRFRPELSFTGGTGTN
jgi:hypothetical protein